MDKDFQSINKLYLSQEFGSESASEDVLSDCRSLARAYALTENAIVVMGDSRNNCSYCYFGGLAEVLGLSADECPDILPSLYEDFIFNRTDSNDLALRHADELAFIKYLRVVPITDRRNYYLSDYMHLRKPDGSYIDIEHRMFPLASTSNGSFWLSMCVYTIAHDEERRAKIVNTRNGDVRMLTRIDYERVLSVREREVLQLIDRGKLSKEIADSLSISINTVNRHRQNILEKLNVDNAIEACRVARVMGIV